ncbi:hypothetical protein COCSUDRAFT_57721 [Coccomyxa subellipsoidea C-169]|uniref:HMG box domain-containing protein n=1 Tax=Coccomyxa subellipsoidea (strain C-169) TaxID=574566 RepID=I0YQA7_COCSC|nr:hypothetical protein COCSUDRAFT_57721 [Coccomyxa subellipsoidea C-169]EIE20576.1 hypothetical protein COCSUDRAFT_57721 [Coccomyxa subellipsoidea C-169]|eukprot:XP_005645120.1 hypothetical protein COCSUDRAFT_57721 [Coccomyxa subellipsoidea C-169]
MAELTDSQLMAELEEFEDAQAPDQLQTEVNETAKAEPEKQKVDPDSENMTPAANAASAGASTHAAKLTVTKKSTTSPAPPADASTPKPSKKIQARVTPDDGDDADQASAVADKDATGKEQAGKGDGGKANGDKKKKSATPARSKAAGQQKKDADGSNTKVKRARSAYIFFGAEKRAAVKAENPTLSFGELTKKLGEMWKGISDAEKAPYEAMASEDKNRAGTERAEAKAEAKLFCDRHRQQIKDENADAGFGEITRKLAAAWKEITEEDKANYNKQHEAHPAETIVAETYHAKYLVKRKGLDFSACGLVDARAAKRQRMLVPDDGDKTESSACHVTVAMMDEWDAFNRSFRCAVHAHSDSGELDLGDAPSHPFSAVDIFNLLLLHLGIMREPDFPLSKAVKNKDVMIKVPMLEISKAVQRVAAVERRAAQEAVAAAAAEREQRTKAEEALAAQQQETLQLRALLKEHSIAFEKGGQAARAEE